MSSPLPAIETSPATAWPASWTDALGDLRFRALLSAEDWARLPAAVRRRFSRKAAAGQTILFVGRVAETRMTRTGWLAAQLCRLIGGPLPLERGAGLPSIVAITEDMCTEGQVWTRIYARRSGFPQVIHSSKRFAGPTGLEEHVGRGVGMTLRILAEADALVFRSDRYFVEIAGWRLYFPHWLTPGRLTVRHAPVDETRFLFSLAIEHPLFGQILQQSILFEEADR